MRFLAVMHHAETSAGLVGDVLRGWGAELDVRRPRFGDALPDVAGYDGAVVFGGEMSANDGDDWLRVETDWIGRALDVDFPLLGVCLGAQVMARRMGATVSRHARGAVEVGVNRVVAGTEGKRALGHDVPDAFCHWHREGFRLPPGATKLAGNDAFEVQAYRRGRAFGFQFHPEATGGILGRWMGSDDGDLAVRCPEARKGHLSALEAGSAATASWLGGFLARWATGTV